jgi:hypothetical protein
MLAWVQMDEWFGFRRSFWKSCEPTADGGEVINRWIEI